MTAKELMNPRFEVIADFPDSHYGAIGTILDRDWAKYPNDDETQKAIWKISDFPHLFRKLNWWEKRTAKQIPKKLICKAIKDDTQVHEIESLDMDILFGWISKKERVGCGLHSFNPEYGYFPID
jgi:hypothetical protein